MKVHYCTIIVEDSPTIQGDLLIKESALNEVVGYLFLDVRYCTAISTVLFKICTSFKLIFITLFEIHGLVLCWADINQSTDQVQDFLELYQSAISTNVIQVRLRLTIYQFGFEVR